MADLVPSEVIKPDQLKKSDFVQSLARGLLVIRSFDEDQRRQTLSDVARRTNLNRATARRLLLTLTDLGYMRLEDRHFSLSPSVLQLGYAYIAALGARAIAQPYLESLGATVDESCSMTVLDGSEVVYVARVPTKRFFSLTLGVGSRLPAHVTSMGRVIMADLSDEEVDEILASSDLEPLTEKTLTDPVLIKAEMQKAKSQGWYLLDEELELGIRAVAAPVFDESGRVTAAVNVSTTVARTSVQEIHENILPALLATVKEISAALQSR